MSYGVGATIGGGSIVYAGTGGSFNDTGLTNGTNYYYNIYSFDGAHNYAAAATEEATPFCIKKSLFEAIDFNSGIGADVKSFITGLTGVSWTTITQYVTQHFEFLPNVTAGLKIGFEISGEAGEGLSVDIASVGAEVSVGYNFRQEQWEITRGISLDFAGDKLSLAGEEYIDVPSDSASPITVGVSLTGEYSLLAPPEIKAGLNEAIHASLSFSDQVKHQACFAVETELTEQDFLARTDEPSLGMALLDSFGFATSSWTEAVADSLGRVFTPFGVPLLSAIGVGDDPLAILSGEVLGGSPLTASVTTGPSAEMSLKLNVGLGASLGVGLSGTVYVGGFVNEDLASVKWEQSFSLSDLKATGDDGSAPATATSLTAGQDYAHDLSRYDANVYTFDSTAGQHHEFIVGPDTTKEVSVVIRDSSQKVLSRMTVRSPASTDCLMIQPRPTDFAGFFLRGCSSRGLQLTTPSFTLSILASLVQERQRYHRTQSEGNGIVMQSGPRRRAIGRNAVPPLMPRGMMSGRPAKTRLPNSSVSIRAKFFIPLTVLRLRLPCCPIVSLSG